MYFSYTVPWPSLGKISCGRETMMKILGRVVLCVMVMWWHFLFTLVTSSENDPLWGFVTMKLAGRGCGLSDSGILTSWNMMKFLISSLTRFWYWTWTKCNVIAEIIGWSYLVPVCRNGHQGWSKADGDVVRVHHVFIAAIGEVRVISWWLQWS